MTHNKDYSNEIIRASKFSCDICLTNCHGEEFLNDSIKLIFRGIYRSIEKSKKIIY